MPLKGRKEKSHHQHEVHVSSETETFLQEKLDKKVQELTELKMRVHTAQEENNWLNQEANKMRIEMDEYGNFMSKKMNLRQTQMITLTDYHRQEIEDIHREKEIMIDKYQQRKEDLRSQLIRKSELLLQAKHELEAMDGYQVIREGYSNEIKRLEQEIKRIRGEHVHELSRFKSAFENEMQEQHASGNIKTEEIQRQANQEAKKYLYDRTVSIQSENTELRKKIQKILKQRQELNQFKQRLEEEQIHLIRRLKLVIDLKKIRLDKSSLL